MGELPHAPATPLLARDACPAFLLRYSWCGWTTSGFLDAAALVLVVDGLAYVSAGLHPQSDGGIRVVCLRPETGEIVWRQQFTDLGFASPWPEPYEPRTQRPDSDPWRCIRPLEYRHFDLPVRDGDSIAVSRCLFDRKTGAQELRKASGYYQIRETGVYLPRTAWRYNDTRMRSPIAVAGGSAVYSTIPGTSQLFRAKFRAGQAFDTDWVQVSLEDNRAGLASSTAKLARVGSQWSVNTPANAVYFHRAMRVTVCKIPIKAVRRSYSPLRVFVCGDLYQRVTQPRGLGGLEYGQGRGSV